MMEKHLKNSVVCNECKRILIETNGKIDIVLGYTSCRACDNDELIVNGTLQKRPYIGFSMEKEK